MMTRAAFFTVFVRTPLQDSAQGHIQHAAMARRIPAEPTAAGRRFQQTQQCLPPLLPGRRVRRPSAAPDARRIRLQGSDIFWRSWHAAAIPLGGGRFHKGGGKGCECEYLAPCAVRLRRRLKLGPWPKTGLAPRQPEAQPDAAWSSTSHGFPIFAAAARQAARNSLPGGGGVSARAGPFTGGVGSVRGAARCTPRRSLRWLGMIWCSASSPWPARHLQLEWAPRAVARSQNSPRRAVATPAGHGRVLAFITYITLRIRVKPLTSPAPYGPTPSRRDTAGMPTPHL